MPQGIEREMGITKKEVITMELVTRIKDRYCHEYRRKGDPRSSFGFGETEEEARAEAVYGPQQHGDASIDRSLGFGNWRLEVTITNDAQRFADEVS
jgi:hypothetical protein